MTTTPSPKTSTACYAQAAIAFGVALFAVVVGVYYLPVIDQSAPTVGHTLWRLPFDNGQIVHADGADGGTTDEAGSDATGWSGRIHLNLGERNPT
jgi:hypothetical protein